MKTQMRWGAWVGVLLLVSCQSAPPPTPAPAAAPTVAETPSPPAAVPAPVPEPAVEKVPDAIEVSRDGFSPLAAPPNHTLAVSIRWSSPATLSEWAVAFVPEGLDPVRTLRGTDAVPVVEWDGKTDAGVLAPQGRYTVVLMTSESGGPLVERDRSIPVLLDIVPPSGSITVTPSPLVLGPGEILVEPPSMVTIRLHLVSGGAPWTTWRLGVFHPDGRRFRDFISEEHRDDQVVWNGRALNNAQLEPGTTYRLEAEVFDVYGNRGLLSTTLPVAAALPAVPTPKATTVTVILNGETLASLPVYFAPYSSDLAEAVGDQRASNDQVLGQLTALLNAASGTGITVVGHANQVLYYDRAKAAYEQKVTLLPLSLARAEAVRSALIGAGVDGATLQTRGVGASDPVAKFSDAENRWKNRRVVLELEEAHTP